MKWILCLITACLLSAFVMFCAHAQYDDLTHNQRQINIGFDGANKDTSISATGIFQSTKTKSKAGQAFSSSNKPPTAK